MAKELAVYNPVSDCTVRIVRGDLLNEPVDVIVNAANEELAHGGGVAGAISRAGGPAIQQESDEIVSRSGPVRTGSAVITGAGQLSCKHVIHAVGPIWGAGNEHAKLESAVRSALKLAEEHSLRSISLPAISSGIFGFPKDQCARVMLDAVEAHLRDRPEGSSLREIRLCNIDEETATIFQQEALGRAVDASAGSGGN